MYYLFFTKLQERIDEEKHSTMDGYACPKIGKRNKNLVTDTTGYFLKMKIN